MIRVLNEPPEKKEETEKDKKAKKVISGFRHYEEEGLVAAFAAKINFPYIDTNLFPVSPESIRLVSEEDARNLGIAAIQKIGNRITLVALDPTQKDVKDFIDNLKTTHGWDIQIFVVSYYNLEKIWERYKNANIVDIVDELRVNISSEGVENFEKELDDLVNLKERIREMPTTKILDIIMSGAYKLGASDVHIEPQEKQVRLRYRIDGVLHDVVELPSTIFRSLISRIKMISGMKINIKDIAQDGTLEIILKDKKIDVRVSILPGNFGETVVMRLLDPASIQVDLENLGLRGLAYETVQKEIQTPEGMILTTGPTGSGKTTTLYAIINKLNTPDKKIITIEDPIEYEVKGISQSQIEKSRGYTFAKGLRAIVRQDPDIILVGEIRDDETADIAINSALTGHLVLSTIHTNSAVATVPRLIEMGVKPSLIPPSINAIIGQRLVRKLCEHCKEEYAPAKESLESIQKILSIISPKAKVEIPKNIDKLYRAKGCPKCNHIGYKGRVGIFEVLTITKEIEELVLEGAGKNELTMAALESGMITMLQDGILKAVEGLTTVEEIRRVTGQGDFLEGIYEQLMNQIFSRKIIISKDIYEKTLKASSDLAQVSALLKNAKTNEINKIIFSAALILKAGDIHIEPGAEAVKIRLRIDGILQEIGEIMLPEYPNLLGEIKILSGLKAETRQGVVDSRFTVKLDDAIGKQKDSSVDIRLSLILGGFGETVVMRLLNQGAVALDVESLGLRKENLNKILEQIKRPNGVVLNTGPTGSGKTTTLYSLLKVLNKPEVKIITVEDPIEYQLEGILQTPINEKEGYTFSSALRSLLRQNPDILMIGEIRDNETALIAAQAALTGHLVLSTLHTNSAVGSIQRLLNMGVSANDIAASSNAFIAQRLVRKLCECKEKVVPSSEEKATIEAVLKTISAKSGIKIGKLENIYNPKGCPKCNQIGYQGRTTISEVLVVDREMKDLINQGATENQIQDKAEESGMITMLQDAILKVVEGETSLSEVQRVTEA